MTTCCYCTADVPDADLPAHLAAHQVSASVVGVAIAVEAIAAYQEVVTYLLRDLRREREASKRLARMTGTATIRMIYAENEAERWQAVACRLWRKYKVRHSTGAINGENR